MPTRLQLRESCERRFGDTANAVVTDIEWNDFLAEGERTVAAASPHWPWLETAPVTVSFAAGVNEGSLPAGVFSVLSVYNDTDNLGMEEMAGRVAANSHFPERGETTGVPTFYRLYGGKLQVFPYPASATTVLVEYPVLPAVMTDDAHTPDFPEMYHDALIHFALAEAYLDDENPSQSEHHRGRFGGMVEQMKTTLLGARGDSYPQIQMVD